MGQPLPAPPNYNAQFDADRVRKATKGCVFLSLCFGSTFGQIRGLLPSTKKTDFAAFLSVLAPFVVSLCFSVRRFGTDERALVDVLTPLGAVEMNALSRSFEGSTGKSLVHVLEKETKGWFEYCLRGVAMGPLAWDCWLLHRACAGIGTNEEYVPPLPSFNPLSTSLS